MRDGDGILADLALAVGRVCVHRAGARKLDGLGIGIGEFRSEIHETQLLSLPRIEHEGHSVGIHRNTVAGHLDLRVSAKGKRRKERTDNDLLHINS